MALPTFKIVVLAAIFVIFLLCTNLYLLGGENEYNEVVNIEEEEIFTYKPANTHLLVEQNTNIVNNPLPTPIVNTVEPPTNNIFPNNPPSKNVPGFNSPAVLQPMNIPANYPSNVYTSRFLNQPTGSLNPFQPSQMLTQEQFEKQFDYPQRLFDSYSFVCKTDLMCPFLSEHLTKNYALTDATALYNQFFYVQTLDKLPVATHTWCVYVAGTNTATECLIEALIRKCSPLGHITMLMGSRIKIVLADISRKNPKLYARLNESLDIFFMDEQIPAQLSGDKAGYSIRLIQMAPKNVQEQALQFMPRSYYINTPCYKMNISDITLDQWDLWLKNLDFDTSGYMRDRSPELAYLDTENRNWDQKQPRIEGQNTWVIKPTLMNIRNVFQTSMEDRFHLHQGNAIHVVRTPEDVYNAIMKDHDAYERTCISNYRIIQKYIENPFLWGTKKADIRVYVLVTSLKPATGYIYTAEYPVRVARSDYNSTDDRAHVTNFSKAQKEENVDNMHYWEEFLAYICATVDQPREEVEARILGRLKLMVKSILQLFENEFQIRGATSITGWDVIFDKDLNPWMMEINPKPDMRMDMSHMSHFKIPLVSEAVDLSFKLARGEEPPQSYGSFVYLN